MKKLLALLAIALLALLAFAACGTDGEDGVDGKDGIDGINGQDGIDGKDGIDGLNGTDGVDGVNGTDGTDGIDGVDGEDGKIPFGFELIKPENNRSVASTSYATYSLAEDVQSLTFTRTLVSGTGPATDEVVLTGEHATAGYHGAVEITGAALVEGDVYDLQVTALDAEGDLVELTPVFRLTVDDTGPELLSAKAYQAVFGEWTPGDRLVFSFSEAMQTKNLESLEDLAARLPDVSAFAYDYFADASLSWSADERVLILTLQDEAAGDVIVAGAEGDADLALFNPTDFVRDYAGNADATVVDVQLLSAGDLIPPRIRITRPSDGSAIPVAPVIHYELSEDLVAATLTVAMQQGGGAEDELVLEWPVDLARLQAGSHSIAFAAEGLPALMGWGIYAITLAGEDGAGNLGFDQVRQLLVDVSAPAAPDADSLFVRNHTHELFVAAGNLVGQPGDYLRLYADEVLVAQAAFPGPYGGAEAQAIFSELPPIAANASIGYSLVDGVGNESAIVSDGMMPPAPSAADCAKLGLRRGSPQDYIMAVSGFLDAPPSDLHLHLVLNQDPDRAYMAGVIMGGIGDISPANISATLAIGDEVNYTYREPVSGHISALSPADGVLVGVQSISIQDMDLTGIISPNDRAEVRMTGGVTIPAGFSQFSYGTCPATTGAYHWSAALSDLNVAPISAGTANSINAPGFWVEASGVPDYWGDAVPAGSDTFYFMMNFAGWSWVYNIEQLMFDLHPIGTNRIRSTDGDHLVLPATQIEASGTTGGLMSPDF